MKKIVLMLLMTCSFGWAQSPQFIELNSISSLTMGKVVLMASVRTKPVDPKSEIVLESTFAGNPIRLIKFSSTESAAVSGSLQEMSYPWEVKAYLQNTQVVKQFNLSIIEAEKEILHLTKLLDQETDLQKRSKLEQAILEAEQNILLYKSQIALNRKLVETKTLSVLGPQSNLPSNLTEPLDITFDRNLYLQGQWGTVQLKIKPENIQDAADFSYEIQASLNDSPLALGKKGENLFSTLLTSSQLSVGNHSFKAALYYRNKKNSQSLLDAIDRGNSYKSEVLDKVQNANDTSERLYYQKEYDDIADIVSAFSSFHLLSRVKLFESESNITVNADSSTFTDISAGDEHVCAVRGGALYCWGMNFGDPLGTGISGPVTIPTLVLGFASGVTKVAVSPNHRCAIRNGGLYCWGNNSYGQLGLGTYDDVTVPTLVPDMNSGVSNVVVGQSHTCALKLGEVYCWGLNVYGAVGSGGSGFISTPQLVPLVGTIGSLSAGGSSTCAVVTSRIYCWGDNSSGKLGIGNTTTMYTPTVLASITSGAESVSVGKVSTCAIVNGRGKCWGAGSWGILGNGLTANSLVPVDIVDFVGSTLAVFVGESSACGSNDGVPYCWGAGGTGALGNGDWANRSVPTPIQNESSILMSVGYSFACLIDRQGDVKCWGANKGGTLGNGEYGGDKNIPVSVIKPPPL